MKYKEIVINQIDKVRQVRNDSPSDYPRVVETLWVLLRTTEARRLIEEKKKALGIHPSYTIEFPDLKQWDTIFQYTIDLISQYEGICL